MVNIEIKVIAEVIDRIRQMGQDIKQGVDVATLQGANLIQGEVQESIDGNRAEPRSVSTGTFGNSIVVDKVQDAEYKIYPSNETYPNGTTVEEVALMLEYGTSRISPRRHFGNTVDRNQLKVIEMVDLEIKKAIG
jgi:hypothetical protein